MTVKKLIVLVIASFWLSACGYHLRGSNSGPSFAWHNLYLENASLKLREQFRKSVGTASGQWAKSPNDANLIIRIIGENSGQQVLSLGPGGRSNELELYYSLEYELLKADNTVLLPQQSMTVRREYFNNQQQILAKANEEAVIRNEMYLEAVQTVIGRSRIVLAAQSQ